jgi:hypothetical protein
MYLLSGPVPDEPRYIAGVCNCSVRKWNAIRQRETSIVAKARDYLSRAGPSVP